MRPRPASGAPCAHAAMQVINLERVGFNLKNFDMAIVFKDFNKEVRAHRTALVSVLAHGSSLCACGLEP